MKLKTFFCITTLFVSHLAYGKIEIKKGEEIKTIFSKHFSHYKTSEFYSGAALSTLVPEKAISNYYIGFVSHNKGSEKVSKDTLFEIGSITKSFTAAILLQLEKEKKLSLDDTVGKWLPEYKKWSHFTIKELLNMTTGIPNYTDSPLFNAAFYKDANSIWEPKTLIQFTYPLEDYSPPLKKGYFYSNTGYLLAALIIEKVTLDSYENTLNKFIKSTKLSNTYYPVPKIESKIYPRLAYGYNYNPYDNALMVGKAFHDTNMSWAGAAGGLIASTQDMLHWVQALFVDYDILDIAQKKKLKELVSTKTGNAIDGVSAEDNSGFGLGVTKKYDETLGSFWFYEGTTFGFRALYLYKECNGIIISTAFNSATNSENDHAHYLLLNVYNELIKQDPTLKCRG